MIECSLKMEIILWYWRSTYQSELIDVDKDGNIDLLVMGHEWDYYYDWCQDNADGNCGRGKIYWGDDKENLMSKENL